MRDKTWRQADLAHAVGLSQAEVTFSLNRLKRSNLIDESKRKPHRLATAEFLEHAVKYLCPAQAGAVCRGIPTAHCAEPLKKSISSSAVGPLVWPSDEGTVRGMSVKPLYKTAPEAALKDRHLYAYLALVDAIRVGGARERNLAVHEIKRMILKRSVHEPN